MQEPAYFPGFPMQNAPPTLLPTHWIFRPPMSPDLQMPSALLVHDYHQIPQSPQLPEGLQMDPDPLVPHYCQRPQPPPLPEGLQMDPGSPVNPGFQVYPLAPRVAPQVLPRPHVTRKAAIREWRGRTRYSPEQKSTLEKFFKKSKYPSFKQRQELAKSVCVMEYQIRIWFKNRRARYFREHPQERLKARGNQGLGAHTSTGDHACINAGATGDSVTQP
uniref:Oocyte specific homeobox 8 n=1 Tax=Mus spicilegus TaxID=10103 RepID=A0A8C6I7W6_MUSSI